MKINENDFIFLKSVSKLTNNYYKNLIEETKDVFLEVANGAKKIDSPKAVEKISPNEIVSVGGFYVLKTNSGRFLGFKLRKEKVLSKENEELLKELKKKYKENRLEKFIKTERINSLTDFKEFIKTEFKKNENLKKDLKALTGYSLTSLLKEPVEVYVQTIRDFLNLPVELEEKGEIFTVRVKNTYGYDELESRIKEVKDDSIAELVKMLKKAVESEDFFSKLEILKSLKSIAETKEEEYKYEIKKIFEKNGEFLTIFPKKTIQFSLETPLTIDKFDEKAFKEEYGEERKKPVVYYVGNDKVALIKTIENAVKFSNKKENKEKNLFSF